LAVAGDHRDPQAQVVERADRAGRLGPDLVLEADRPDDPPRVEDVEHGLAVATPRLGRGDWLDPEIGEDARPADGDLAAIDRRLRALAGNRLESRALRHLDAAPTCGVHDRLCERVFRVRLDGGR